MKSLLFILLLIPSLSFAQHKVAPDFSPSGEWFNSEPLHISDLKGKVVMVEMWTFACNNSYNSIPTLQNFYSKYNSQGFEIVGVHTPEFDYEKEAGNVAEALIKHEVTWPVFQDNDFTTWRAYDIHAWPTFVLVDKQGNIRYSHRGELSERFPRGITPLDQAIQELLAEK